MTYPLLPTGRQRPPTTSFNDTYVPAVMMGQVWCFTPTVWRTAAEVALWTCQPICAYLDPHAL